MMLEGMIYVRITAELDADEHGPYERYVERFTLPADFAPDPEAAHARLLGLIASTDY